MKNKRLTTKLADGTVIKRQSGGYLTGDYIDKLSDYEDSGLSPNQVHVLKEENEILGESFRTERERRELLELALEIATVECINRDNCFKHNATSVVMNSFIEEAKQELEEKQE